MPVRVSVSVSVSISVSVDVCTEPHLASARSQRVIGLQKPDLTFNKFKFRAGKKCAWPFGGEAF